MQNIATCLLLHSGGEAEMQTAYAEAKDAIFSQRVKAHRHMQAYVSRKTGKTKWGELEMWPVHVCPYLMIVLYLLMVTAMLVITTYIYILQLYMSFDTHMRICISR